MTFEISEEFLCQFNEYIAVRMGLYFPRERLDHLGQGLRKAATELGFADTATCARWLMQSSLTKRQVETLASHLTVGETYFFRDPRGFEILEEQILPPLVERRRVEGRYLRIWTAGCATGEEPYSVAILLRRMIPDIGDWNMTIHGTDINPSFLRKAEEGVYGDWSFREVPRRIKERCFSKTASGRFQILPEIRQSVVFSYLNLAEDQYPSLLNNTNAMDIIFCRNVLMYFSRDRQGDVVQKLYRSLAPGGLLIVSPIEMSSALFSAFVPLRFQGATFYRKDINKETAPERLETDAPPLFEWARETVVARPSLAAMAESDTTEIGSTPEATPEIRQLETVAPRSPDLYQEALAFYRQGQYDEAEKRLAEFLAGDGHNPRALALRSRVYANMGRLPEAREACEKAVAADKLNPGHHYLLATILQEAGLPREAAASLKRALYLDQNFVLAHFSLGTLALRMGAGKEADRHFENSLAVLKTFRHDEILPESEGVTAGRMEEIIKRLSENEVG